MAIYQRTNGGPWQVDFRYKDPKTGKSKRFRRTTGITIKKDALKLERRWKREAQSHGSENNQPSNVSATKMGTPFSGAAKRFVDDYARVHNKPSEVTNKLQIIKNHLHPFFRHMPVETIRRRDIDAYIASKKRGGLHTKTLNNHIGVMSRMFNCFVEWELIQVSPMNGVKKLKTPEATFDFYTGEETNLFLNECHKSEPFWRPFFVTAFNTGMRLGELAALRWDDVDFERDLIHVRRNLYRGHEGTPKGGRNRQIPMNQLLKNVLQKHYQTNKKNPRVFLSLQGTDLTVNSHRRSFERIIKKAGLKRIRFHDVRHSFASQLVMNGVILSVVQELLGHSTIAMTERYSHLAPGLTHDAVKTLMGSLVIKNGSQSGHNPVTQGKNGESLDTSNKEKARKYKDLRAG